MTTPPRVSRHDAELAVAAIVERHRRAGDDDVETIGDEPADLLSYLRKRWKSLPHGVRAEDLQDAAVLHVWLWWDHQQRERWLFDQAVKTGVNRLEFAGQFGVKTRPGFQDRRDRLHALLDETGPGRPDEQTMRADRAGARSNGDGTAWLDTAKNEVLAVAREIDAFYPLVDDATADVLIEVRRDLRDGRYSADTVAWIAEAVQALADCPTLGVAERTAPLVRRWHQLAAGRDDAGMTRPD